MDGEIYMPFISISLALVCLYSRGEHLIGLGNNQFLPRSILN